MFMLWQPAELKLSSKGGGEVSTDDPVAEMKTRKSPNHEAAVFIADLAKNGIRCLCFVESRAQCESVKREVRTILNKDNCLHTMPPVFNEFLTEHPDVPVANTGSTRDWVECAFYALVASTEDNQFGPWASARCTSGSRGCHADPRCMSTPCP